MASHPSLLGMIAIGAVLKRSLVAESLSRKIHNRSALEILFLTMNSSQKNGATGQTDWNQTQRQTFSDRSPLRQTSDEIAEPRRTTERTSPQSLSKFGNPAAEQPLLYASMQTKAPDRLEFAAGQRSAANRSAPRRGPSLPRRVGASRRIGLL